MSNKSRSKTNGILKWSVFPYNIDEQLNFKEYEIPNITPTASTNKL